MLGEIYILEEGKKIPINTKEDYFENRNLVVDLLNEAITVHADRINKFKRNSTETIRMPSGLEIEVNFDPDLLFDTRTGEVRVNETLYPTYRKLLNTVGAIARVMLDFGDRANFEAMLLRPEMYPLLVLAGADNEATNMMVKAEEELFHYYEDKANLTPDQKETNREVLLVLDTMREQAQKGMYDVGLDLGTLPKFKEKGITGKVYPCWDIER